ncbi:MAG: hypothetical protein J5I98_27710 [Phaeodactylibacter sp.]|nr:hypothetical protein [Phaeodactylibacter sp.]
MLKEDSREGWNGTVSGNVGNLSRLNASLLLNYGGNNLSAFGSYAFRHANTPRRERVYGQAIQPHLGFQAGRQPERHLHHLCPGECLLPSPDISLPFF